MRISALSVIAGITFARRSARRISLEFVVINKIDCFADHK
jgi:hypothetical protein